MPLNPYGWTVLFTWQEGPRTVHQRLNYPTSDEQRAIVAYDALCRADCAVAVKLLGPRGETIAEWDRKPLLVPMPRGDEP